GRDALGLTGIAIINVGQGGENAISVIGGVNLALDSQDIERGSAALKRAKVLLLQLEVPIAASLAAARMVRDAGGTVILDPAPAPRESLPVSVLAAIDILTPNESEAAAILGWMPMGRADGLRAAGEPHSVGVSIAMRKRGADW